MEITIDLMKKIALNVYDEVNELIGTTRGAKKLEQGAGGDISMKIDVVAEKRVIKTLEEHNVDILLISEEIGNKYIGNESIAKQEKKKLIVDPIDGSTNSSRGIPFSSVSIAYAVGEKFSDIQKAVILDLTTKDIYWSEKGKGTYCNDERIYVSDKIIKDQVIFEIDFSIYNLIAKVKKFKPILRKIYRVRVLGSIALSFCLLARGNIDGYINLRKGTRLYDIAASFLIVKEAGGKIFTKMGEDIENYELSTRNLPILACNANLEDFLKVELEKINRV